MRHRKSNRILSVLLALALLFVLTACTAKPAAPEPEETVSETAAPEPALEPAPDPEPEPEPVRRNDLVGISMPTKEIERWRRDGIDMRRQLEQLGYEVDLQFAGNDSATQASQIEHMIANNAKALVITFVNGGEEQYSVLEQARAAGCAVIAYDYPIAFDAVSGYVRFDNAEVGAALGRFIADRLDLANADDKVYNIEFVGGSPGDGDEAYVFHNGYMNELQKYIDAGTLNVVSGQVDFEAIATENWSPEKAQERFQNILTTYYADQPLHAVLAEYDAVAQGVAAALESTYTNEVYPIITGQGCDLASVRNILQGRQAMSVFKDTRDLAAKAVEMADAVMTGAELPANGQFTTVDCRFTYPVFNCEPTVCTEDNIVETMLGYGRFTAEEMGQ